jgi:hypothetical protein
MAYILHTIKGYFVAVCLLIEILGLMLFALPCYLVIRYLIFTGNIDLLLRFHFFFEEKSQDIESKIEEFYYEYIDDGS